MVVMRRVEVVGLEAYLALALVVEGQRLLHAQQRQELG